MKTTPIKPKYNHYSGTVKLKKGNLTMLDDRLGVNPDRWAYLIMCGSSKKMVIDIMVYSSGPPIRIVKNKNLPNHSGVFVLSLKNEKKKRGIKDITGIMIINLMKSVTGEIEMHLLEEKRKLKTK